MLNRRFFVSGAAALLGSKIFPGADALAEDNSEKNQGIEKILDIAKKSVAWVQAGSSNVEIGSAVLIDSRGIMGFTLHEAGYINFLKAEKKVTLTFIRTGNIIYNDGCAWVEPVTTQKFKGTLNTPDPASKKFDVAFVTITDPNFKKAFAKDEIKPVTWGKTSYDNIEIKQPIIVAGFPLGKNGKLFISRGSVIKFNDDVKVEINPLSIVTYSCELEILVRGLDFGMSGGLVLAEGNFLGLLSYKNFSNINGGFTASEAVFKAYERKHFKIDPGLSAMMKKGDNPPPACALVKRLGPGLTTGPR